MPKRIVDGDAIATSEKIAAVQSPSYRAEFAYLLTFALADGTFEADPRLIWTKYYAFNREDITQETIAAILAEYERVDLLRRWKVENKTWGWWVGNDKPGRLPKPSDVKAGRYGVGVGVPDAVRNRAIVSPQGSDNGATGLGVGKGLGEGRGEGLPSVASSLRSSPPPPSEVSQNLWGVGSSTKSKSKPPCPDCNANTQAGEDHHKSCLWHPKNLLRSTAKGTQ